MTTQGLKRSAPCENEQLEDVKAVVLNLEGSTIPRSFIEVRTYSLQIRFNSAGVLDKARPFYT